jgi:hypothetical protein
MRQRVTRLLLLGAVVVFAPAPPALADGGDATLIHACQGPPRGGLLPPPRLVDAATACRSGETAVHWPAIVPPAPRPGPVIRDATNAPVGTYLGMKDLLFVYNDGSQSIAGPALPLVRLTDGSREFGALVAPGQILGTSTFSFLRFTGPNCTGTGFLDVDLVDPFAHTTQLPPTFGVRGDPRLWVADLAETPATRSASSSLSTFLVPPCSTGPPTDYPNTIPFVEVTPTFTPPFRLVIE